tara:strand:- start:330 stop:1094 length:765 start_codon:yes stop_codon:yes gene_type:complete
MQANKIIISIVIHNQAKLVEPLIEDLLALKKTYSLKIFLRVNTNEDVSNLKRFLKEPCFKMLHNIKELGYGSNHNLNFRLEKCDFFIVLNPDIRLVDKHLEILFSHFELESVGVVAPRIISNNGNLEDSIRDYPSLTNLFKRYLLKNNVEAERRRILKTEIDWCAGMFMVFSYKSFSFIGGFDTKYFMYLEDADICLRLKYLASKKVFYEHSFECIHNAQRASRSILKKHFFWHFSSLLKFQLSYIRLKYLRYH